MELPVLISLFIFFSLLGSMLWVLPSPKERQQAKIRLEAKMQGVQVRIEQLLPPRAIGALEAERYNSTSYSLNRTKQQKQQGAPWQVFRLKCLTNRDLPEDWSWGKGEDQLSTASLKVLNEVLAELPEQVSAVAATPIQVSIYWDSEDNEQDLILIKLLLEKLLVATL